MNSMIEPQTAETIPRYALVLGKLIGVTSDTQMMGIEHLVRRQDEILKRLDRIEKRLGERPEKPQT